MMQTTLWALEENNPAIVRSFLCLSRWQDAPISASYIVVDSFIAKAWVGLWAKDYKKKFQFTTKFPW